MAHAPYTVVSGPSREVLGDCIRLAEEFRVTEFEWVAPGDHKTNTEIVITGWSIDPDGMIGQSWIIDGYVTEGEGDTPVKIWYNSSKWSGVIHFCVGGYVGPSGSPHDLAFEDQLFVKSITELNLGQDMTSKTVCFVGPFDSYDDRQEFIDLWMRTLADQKAKWFVSFEICNLLPAGRGAIPPSEFRGFIRYDGPMHDPGSDYME